MAERLKATALDLDADLGWLAALLQHRLDTYFAEKPASPVLPGDRVPPMLDDSPSPYAEFLAYHDRSDGGLFATVCEMAFAGRCGVAVNLDLLTIDPDAEDWGDYKIRPEQVSVQRNEAIERLRVIHLLTHGEALLAGNVLLPLESPPGESILAGRLQAVPALLALFNLDAPGGEADALPAQRVTTGLNWADLVLPPATLAHLEEVRDWLEHGETLLHTLGMAARVRPGYTCLFHGPPGTGKTLTACLLGKLCEREVHRVDLSMVVSKYIGETEKNLARVFDLAEQRGWILFFDEADALFGQRTRVDSAHDRYANQEVSYLLQRIEDFSGVVILSSNLRGNIDDAFSRRFQSVIAFPMPQAEERYRLWTESVPALLERDVDLDFVRLAEKHEISGGTIINIIRYAALRSLVRGDRRLAVEDINDGLRRELHKEGRGF